MEEIILGKIVNTYGLKGELKLLLDPLYADLQFKKEAKFHIEDQDYVLLHYQKKKLTVIFSLKNHQDINLVEKLKGKMVSTANSELASLTKGDFYAFELLGFEVFDQNDQLIGRIINVEDTGYQKLLRIESIKDKEVLIPWVDFFVKSIATNEKKVVVETIEGLI